MQADSPAPIMASLGTLEDRIDEMLPAYSEACAFLARFERMERMLYLATKQQMLEAGALESAKTETEKKDRIEILMRENNPELFTQVLDAAEKEARGKALFKGMDAQRSIGQSLLKIHTEAETAKRFGQGAKGQAGQ